jgi:glycosyltransferase involved in cell wall biosynthesis
MKVCFINSFYWPEEVGGAERSVRTLAERLVAQGHSAWVICNGQARESTSHAGVQIERLPCPNLYHPLAAAEKTAVQKLLWHGLDSFNPFSQDLVRKLLEEFKPDVLHTNTLAGLSVSVWKIARDMGIPLVHTLRDYYLLCPNTAMYKNQTPCRPGRCASCRVLSTPRISATRHVNAVVGNSRFILNKHLAHGCFKEATHHVIYSAYQAPASVQVRPPLLWSTEARAALGQAQGERMGVQPCPSPVRAELVQAQVERATLGSTQDLPREITLGYIGRLARTKGVEMLIEAYLHIRRERAELPLKLVIAGRGEANYEQSLHDLASADPSIVFLGQVKPEAFYEQIDFPVVPSLWDEPLARVLFESFAHALPVIASTTGGSPELIREGENGWLFDPKEPSALLDKLRLVLNQLEHYPQWSANSLRDAAMFVPQRTLDDYAQLYEKIIEPVVDLT